MKKVIRIRNLDCAACAAELSEELAAIEGVSAATADFINQRVSLEYEGEEALGRCIDAISHFEEVEIIDANAPKKKDRHVKEVVSIAVSAAFFVPALVLQLLGYEIWYDVLFFCSFAAAGWAVAVNAFRNAVRAFKDGFHPLMLLDENLLMLIAAIGALALRENLESASVMLLYQIGELLQDIAVGSSRNSITRLMELRSDTALRLTEGGQEEVSPEELTVGDRILLRRGDRVPVDCKIVTGETALDTKSLSGEAYLKEVGVGDEVLAGCVNEGSVVTAEVVRPASESAVAKILELVENSSSKKAKPEKFITKFARVYTPVVVLLAVVLAVVPPLFQNYNFSVWVMRALNFLVISCPCALIISVPLTYFSGVGTLARYGVLAKGGIGLDTLAKAKVAAFDKTGTLTEGKFSIAAVHGEPRALLYAASAEQNSSHPLAEAFAGEQTVKVENCREIAGMGISCEMDGNKILVGSLRFLRENGVQAEPLETENLAVYVAENGISIGCIEIADRVRGEAEVALTGLKEAGIQRVAVLTGDSEARAKVALSALPVDEIHAGLLPEQKPEAARTLKKGETLLYVGDGINDTPVMAESDVSFAMGALGSDAAIEAADFILTADSLSALPTAVRGAKKTRRIVYENIVFSIFVKIALMGLSLFGFLPAWAAVFGDVGVMLLAVLNSMRMRLKL